MATVSEQKVNGVVYSIMDATARQNLTNLQAATRDNKGTYPTNSDFNDIQYNSIWGINSNSTYSNKPPVESGFCITTKYSDGIVSQIAFELNYSQVFCRRLYNATWSEWELLNKDRNQATYGILPTGSDLDDLEPNTIYGLYSEYTYINAPDIISGIIVSVPFGIRDTNVYIQVILSFGEGVYYRNKITTWRQWKRIDFEDRSSFERVNDRLANNSDFNDYTENGKWGLTSGNTYLNNPLPSVSGWLECKVFQSGIYTQRVYDLSGRPAYTRYKIFDNDWTDWLSEDGKDPQAVYYAFGDSTTYGQIGGVGGQSKYNYPAVTGKLLNMKVKNKAVGGQGLIKNWDDIQQDYIEDLDMSDAKLITIGWAYNDSGYYSGMNFGAYTDTGDTTFIGKYYTIMKDFQTKCPTAQIVLITGYGYPDGTVSPVTKPTLQDQFTHKYTFSDGQKSIKEMYDTLEAMANLHGWPCVNQSKGTVFNQFNASEMIGDQIHPTNEGYYRYGQLIGAKIAQFYGNVFKW